MSRKSDWAIDFVLLQEGGEVNDPRDPGRLTKYGISQRAHPREDIRNLTVARARKIYFDEYWEPTRCQDMPDIVALAVMDFAVNAGVSKATVRLQRAINEVGGAGIRVDGDIGDETIGTLKRCEPWLLFSAFNGMRLKYYWALRKTSLVYAIPGWMGRVGDLLIYAAAAVR